ncbi:multidrug ABC transporter ATP-binding protein [Acrocarpospora phusangensis]|uniref:Multidrug ABC transporter ATP-binding protein n=1 Tax=Acrocarpospora phusangensis TaxID=1070424 RepID=A0A919UPK3_9ACTN|nr:ABC transporter ATP-binding protein [Acrocarpospora phusangensis]GIH29761.1 multidrug ABC transporter ATP-binding protein [Acrocarpospora phusangensis]
MLLRIQELTKDYRRGVRANHDISLTLDQGQVLGLFGHNGAGKTTLLNQVAGLVRPTSGTIHIDGADVAADPALARRSCSLQPQAQAPIDGVTPRQAIDIMARIRGAGRRRARRRTDALLEALDIGAWADTPGQKLSGGVRRLTAFGMAAAEPGRIVMLDEPTNDVDPVRRRLLWEQIIALADSGCAVLVVTHNVVEAERSMTRLAVLNHGRLVAEGTPAQLRHDYADRLRLELVAVDDETAIRLEAEAGGPGEAVRTGRRVVVPIDAAAAGEALSWAQRERVQGRVEEFSVTPVSIEEVYIGLVGPDAAGTEEGDRAARVT